MTTTIVGANIFEADIRKTHLAGPVSHPPDNLTVSVALVHPPPHRCPLPHRIEQRPVPLLDDMPPWEWRARFLAQRARHAVVAVSAEERHAVEREKRHTAFLLEDGGPIAAAVGRRVGEGATGELRQMGQRGARVGGVAFEAFRDVGRTLACRQTPALIVLQQPRLDAQGLAELCRELAAGPSRAAFDLGNIDGAGGAGLREPGLGEAAVLAQRLERRRAVQDGGHD